jgi:hypothetical protein
MGFIPAASGELNLRMETPVDLVGSHAGLRQLIIFLAQPLDASPDCRYNTGLCTKVLCDRLGLNQ